MGRGPAVEQVEPGRYVIDGNLAIHEWADAFGMGLKGRRISTLGGFVTSRLGRIATEDDVVRYRNLEFKVASMRGRRVEKLSLRLLEDAS